ncbi:SGNH/GDSL hydrolase family protein [Pseudomonas fulva]|uniref:SGNH/GDSL hydrolase family protein n=2 Tax=Pseudomonas fulva TaxID=47880 RepID=UPI00067262D3|nr:SGNH/GDSL hydrolase family protein [Pseudomonas fulva]
MANNTFNPIPSSDPRDLFDNAATIDMIINSGEDRVPARFGQMLYTWGYFHRLVETAVVQIDGVIANATSQVNARRDSGIAEISQSVAAVDAAEAAAKADMLQTAADLGSDIGNKSFATYTLMQAYVPKYEGQLAWVQADTDPLKNGFYQWKTSSAAWVKVADQIITDSTIVRFIAPSALAEDYLQVADIEGGLFARLGAYGLRTREVELLVGTDGRTLITDGEGGVSLDVSESGGRVGSFEFQYTDLPGVLFTDPEGAIIFDPASSSQGAAVESTLRYGLMFKGPLAIGPAGMSLYVAGLIKDRSQAGSIVCSASSDTTAESSTGPCVRLSSDFGTSGSIVLRSQSSPDYRVASKFNVVKITKGTSARPLNILFIGDSIGNREGVKLLGEYLAELNLTANFIGTINSSSLPGAGNDDKGPLCEAREGWESGDFTYAVTDRVQIVAPGDEAAYLALGKSARWPKNPFLRAATGSDSPSVVRNGYVFDPAFYQSRFGFPTPDIVINALGTNDVRDRSVSTIYADVLDGENVIHSQILAAWPSAKVLRTFPGTGSNIVRDAAWLASYSKVFAAIRDAAASKPQVKIAPLWAVSDTESGYALPTATNSDGDPAGDWFDAVHPIGSTRRAYYQQMAPFVVAAFDSLI